MIFCTLLNPAIDLLLKVQDFQPGKTYTDVESRGVAAGKGINVAKVARTLGEEVTVVGVVPENDLQRYRQFLERHALRWHLIPVAGDTRLNITITDSKNGMTTHLSSGSAIPSGESAKDELLTFLRSRPSPDDIWNLSGSIPSGMDETIYMKMIQCCHEHGARTMLDSRGIAFNLGVRGRPSMIKPNLSELEEFFGEQIHGVHHIALKGKRFIDMGIEYVFISLGADGMIAIHENDCLLCSPPRVDAIDTVGCGDALVAGFLVAFTRKFAFAEACRLAIACGASSAKHQGPGEIERDEVWHLMEEVAIESV